VQARLRDAAQRAVFTTIAKARRAGMQAWYSLAAASTLEEVNRADDRSMFLWVRSRHGASGRGRTNDRFEAWRPQYVWGVLRSAMIAKALGMERMSAIELGVAGGNGLVALETAAEEAESLLGIGIDVFGFDSGSGMPAPVDHRDAPFSVREGQFDIDTDKLRSRLGRAELVLGDVAETVPEFLKGKPAPVGFVSFDIDYYSSTMNALELFKADTDRLLPRVICYFQGILWHPWTAFNGQRAAIKEFNADQGQRKISPVYGLKYSLPSSEYRRPWPEMMYVVEVFDHELYDADQHIPPLDTSLAD
jgi:hypothetical protein